MRLRLSLLVSLCALMTASLGGCDARRDLWIAKVGEQARAFIAFFPCSRAKESVDPANPPPLTYYQLTRWQFGVYDPRRGVFGAPVSDDGFAYAFTYFDAYGGLATEKAFLTGISDAAGRQLSTTPGQRHWTSTGTCAGVTSLPWSDDHNRPFWVADATLAADPAPLSEASARGLLALYALGLMLIASIPIAAAGYFDASEKRRGGVWLSIAAAIGSLIVLSSIHSAALSEPHARLIAVQAYYRAYDELPKVDGRLLPLDIRTLRPLLAGPPLTVDLEQTPDTFWTWFGGALIVFFLISAKRFVMGAYWLFVPLPLEVSFRRARKRGEWPKAQELIDAIRRGTVGKTTWQARAMTLKAEKFARELTRLRDQLVSRTRHERT